MQATILYVEGNDDVRGTVARALRHLGFRVVTAEAAADALALASHEPRVDILFSELGLFGMTGITLAREVEALHRAAVVITTDDPDRLAGSGFDHDRHFALFKPFNLTQLEDVVKQALVATVHSEEPSIHAMHS